MSRPLHRRAGLHRVVIGEHIFYLRTDKIQVVFEDDDGQTTIVVDSGAKIQVPAPAHDVLGGIAEARDDLAREAAANLEASLRDMRERRHAGNCTRKHEDSAAVEQEGAK
jgi:hypothetical protein